MPTPESDRAALLSLLDRRALPVPVDPVSEIEGLKRFGAEPKAVQPALEVLAKAGKFPFNAGFTRDVQLGEAPHDPNALGWRPGRGDVVHVNQKHPFVQALLQNPQLSPLLASIILHENEHIGGADEQDARAAQSAFLKSRKDATADKFAALLQQ